MQSLNIGKDFSPDPSGRYYSDSDASGEKFREEFLKVRLQSLNEGEKLQIILDDGVEGYGSSFLVEGFAGMVKHGYMKADEILQKLEIVFTDQDFDFYKQKIISYIRQADFNSSPYNPSKK